MNPFDSESFGERALREMERMDAITRPMRQIETIMQEAKLAGAAAAAMPSAVEAAMREVERATQLSKLTGDFVSQVSTSHIEDLVTKCSTSAGHDIVETVTRQSAQLSDLISKATKPIKLPNDWMDNLVVARRPDFTTNLTKFDFPVGISLARLQEMSDEEIKDFLAGNVTPKAVELALHELKSRHVDRVSRRHWSDTWMFWVVVASFVVSLIALIVALR